MPSLVRNRRILTDAASALAAFGCASSLVALVVLVGCDGSGPAADPASPSPTSEASQSPASQSPASQSPAEQEAATAAGARPQADEADTKRSDTASLPLKFASWDDITKQVAASGRPAVLDVWALSCEPCLQEFPGLVRLHNELGARVACYAVNIEFDGRKTRPPETYREPVEAFLTRVEAKMPNFISTTPSDEIYTAAEIDSIPAVIVYAADGTIAKKFVDAGDSVGFTYDKDIIPLVRQLLADASPAP